MRRGQLHQRAQRGRGSGAGTARRAGRRSAPARAGAKTGSLVYCAMPMPRCEREEPRSRSRARQPSSVVSSVTTIASQPHASARRDEALDELVRRAPVELEPARRVAHRRGDLLHRRRRLVGEDHRDALGARRRAPTARSASRWASSSTPIGAEQQRRRDAAAEQLDRRVARGTSRSTRGHDPPGVERGAVGGHRRLAPGAAGHVGVGGARHRAARLGLQARPRGGDPRATARDPVLVDRGLAGAANTCRAHRRNPSPRSPVC